MCVKNTYQRLDRIQIWRPEDGLMNPNFPFHFSTTSYLKSKIHNTHENAHIQNPSSFSYQLNVLSSPPYTHTYIHNQLLYFKSIWCAGILTPGTCLELLLGTGDPQTGRPGVRSTHQPQPPVCYGSLTAYESQVLDKFFSRVSKQYFPPNLCNYFQIVYLDNANT